jgi:DNA polymerase (family 10)
MILAHPKVLRSDLAGSLRRKMEVVRNINLLASSDHPGDVLTAFSKFPGVEAARHQNTLEGLFSLSSGIEVDLRIVPDDLFPFALYHLTGSLAHLNSMRAKAMALGFELRESGLFRGGRLIRCKEEGGVFDALGLDFIPPELRENQGEIEFAEAHELPHLIEDGDIQGVFHVHSSYSDGTNSIRGTALEAMNLGFSYVGLSDHSQSARYAGGLTFDRLRRQWHEIDAVNDEMTGFHIFKGTESDILADGSLDYDDATLEKFDFVVASIHSQFNMSMEEMTRRVIKAIRNPRTTILAHPTGRLLLAREPYAIDMIRVIDEASRSGVAIELNAHPYRLDLDWRLCKYAKERGVKIAIDPDTHDREGLKDTRYGVGIARKGWLEPGDVLNTMSLEQVSAFLERRERRR